MIQKILSSKLFRGVSAFALVAGVYLASSGVSLAQEFNATTAQSEVVTFIGILALIIGGVVAAILALLAALIGLGWGVRKFMKWVGGRKF